MRFAAVLIIIALANATPAFAHSSARGFVLLLPTNYVILGGALAVLATFAAVSVLPDRLFQVLVLSRMPLLPRSARLPVIVSLLSAAILIALIWIGIEGPHDPAENLLPLSIWTLWWVVIVLLHPVFGNLWAALNPFSGIHAVTGMKPMLKFPDWLEFVPALMIFAAFAWFQLVYPAPEDPARLVAVVAAYAVITLLAVFLFGPETWMSKGDPFGVFLSQLGASAPLGVKKNIELGVPGAGLASCSALPLAGTLFVLLTLSSISFDGFANTFLWLSTIGINPLDYPGRTALMSSNTLGLVASFVVLAVIYAACISLGWRWAGKPGSLSVNMGRFVFSLIPISIAYHFAHYLSDTLVNLQYLALALNDPMGSGADFLGLGNHHITASFQNTASGTFAIFTAQTSAIIVGHVIGVAVAHMIATGMGLTRTEAWRLEAPLTIFMIAYTAFGLWLLATPSIG